MTKTRTLAALAAASTLGLSGAAYATTTYTAVQAAAPGERNHAQILSQIYGGTFALAANGRDYAGSGVTARRLLDSAAAAPTSLTTGVSAGDSLWSGPATVNLSAKAKYAAHSALFGWIDGASGGTFTSLLSTSQLDSARQFSVSGQFRFALKNTTTGRLFTSAPGGNPGGADQLVTYQVSGAGIAQPTWLLFWEDLNAADCSDWDYNDSVVCITAPPPSVPAPASAGLLAGAALGLARRRRR